MARGGERRHRAERAGHADTGVLGGDRERAAAVVRERGELTARERAEQRLLRRRRAPARDRERRLADLPALRMLGAPADAVAVTANELAAAIGAVRGLTIAVEACASTVGGGAMPTASLPSWAVTLKGASADQLDRGLRRAAIVGRIEDGRVWLDVRTVPPADLPAVVAAVRALA